MTAPTAKPPGYTAPACRLGEHGACHGNQRIQLHECQAPVQTLRCDCACHVRRRT